MYQKLDTYNVLDVIRGNSMYEPRIGEWLYHYLPAVKFYTIYHFFLWGDLMDFLDERNLILTNQGERSLGEAVFMVVSDKKNNVGYIINGNKPPFILSLEEKVGTQTKNV